MKKYWNKIPTWGRLVVGNMLIVAIVFFLGHVLNICHIKPLADVYHMTRDKAAVYQSATLVLEDGDTLSQEIYTSQGLHGIYLRLQNEEVPKDAGFSMTLSDLDTGKVLNETEITASSSYSIRELTGFCLSSEYRTMEGAYIITLAPHGFGNTPCRVSLTDDELSFTSQRASINGKMLDGCYVMDLIISYSRLRSIFYLFIGAFAFLGCLVYSLTFVKKIPIPVRLMIALLAVGLLYCVILSPFNSPDEGRHFGDAYYAAIKLSGTDVGELEDYQIDYNLYSIPARTEDISTERYGNNGYTLDDMLFFYNDLRGGQVYLGQTENLVTPAYDDPIIEYFTAAVGMIVARAIGVNGAWLVLFARWAIFLTYVGLACLAVALIPRGKAIICCASMLPLALSICMSISNDYLSMGFGLLIIAIVCRVLEARRWPLWYEISLLLLANVFLLIAHQFHIIMMTLLLLGIGELEIYASAKIKKILMIVIPVAALLVLILTPPIARIMGVEELSGGCYSLGFVLLHPIRSILYILQTIFLNEDPILFAPFGADLGWLDMVPTMLPVALVIAVCVVTIQHSCVATQNKMRVVYGIAALATILVSFVAAFRYTTPDILRYSHALGGMQSRYFLPALPLLALAISGRVPENVETIPKEDGLCAWTMTALFLANGWLMVRIFWILLQRV